MRHRTRFSQLTAIVLSLCCTIAILAQDATCPVIVTDALRGVADACQSIGRNQVCYGNLSINASNQEGVSITDFAAAGDTVDVADIAQLVTAPLNIENSEWGIAVMVLQADIPDTLPGQNVTFVIFGDASLEVDTDAPDDFAAPMQAFRFATGLGQLTCDEAPRDGILVQSPDDVTVNFRVNGVEVALGSTAYITSTDDDAQRITLLEGQADIMTDDGSQTVEAGFTVDITDDRVISEPEPLDPDTANVLPIALLPRPIAIPVILTASEATVDWVDSGITVEAGKTYQITATGRTNLWPQCNALCQDNAEYTCESLCTAIAGGPAGTEYVTNVVPSSDPFMVMPGERFLILLGRVGDGEMFIVGDDLTFSPDTDGTLFFRINEDTRVPGDEPGVYAVSVLELVEDVAE